MGNAWVFPSICHSMRKCNKIHRIEKTRKIGNHTFPIVWVLFPQSIPILRYTYYMGNVWVLPTVSDSMKKCNKTHRMGRAWEIGTHAFSIVWTLFSVRFPSYGTLHYMENA